MRGAAWGEGGARCRGDEGQGCGVMGYSVSGVMGYEDAVNARVLGFYPEGLVCLLRIWKSCSDAKKKKKNLIIQVCEHYPR